MERDHPDPYAIEVQENRVLKENAARLAVTKARTDYVVKNDVVVGEIGKSGGEGKGILFFANWPNFGGDTGTVEFPLYKCISELCGGASFFDRLQ